ncbi:hypothetical protein HMPREF0389_00612 [Filifactor alocis ATCC 35896]|uniref:Uncharacterized protein n=1 Tax=Filifactor alocis (strain ATCC 35896 / CCUG 47790 / D40 B5) TaxID=546269 RepID=D6GPJ1_FILAD|nr:hypothetical protein [Filifactor alocis]EFE28694.1 hypothetical protein HMPREF0389_00612 [Filifactor alocis ATCC 35896]
MQLKRHDREFIEELYNEINPYKICDIFDLKSKTYKEAKLIYFNLGINPYLEPFKNKILNGYSILGVSDYEKSYVFDNKYNSKENRAIEIGKTINLDLNVLTYLKNIVTNRKLEDEQNFIDYLKYIKESNYNLNMSISLFERISKPIYLKVWSDYVLSFVKYETLENITKDSLKNDEILPEAKYIWAKEILDSSEYMDEKFDQFYVVACILSKAFILKTQKMDSKRKFLELLNYSLNELNIYLEFELYLMYKYLQNNESVERTFAKIQGISNRILENIKNTAWDILHIRLVEEQIIDDLKKGKVIFHYIGTKDIGLQKIININPLKIIGFLDDQKIIVREYNFKEEIQCKEIDEMLEKHINKNNIGDVNYKEKFEKISNEIAKMI